MGLFSSSTKVLFNLKSKHSSGKYTCNNNKIDGHIEIKLDKDIKNVHCIEYGLKGTIIAAYYDTIDGYRVEDGFNVVADENKRIPHTYHEIHELFDITLQDPNHSVQKDESYYLKKTDKLVIPITHLSFPNTQQYLPSSTSAFGTKREYEGSIDITYSLYLRIIRKSSILSHHKNQYFSTPVIYQANSSQLQDTNYLEHYYSTGIPEKKSKYFINNKIMNGSIDSFVDEWNVHNDRSTELNDLNVVLTIPRFLDSETSIFNQFLFEFETLINSDSYGKEPVGSAIDGPNVVPKKFKLKSIDIIIHYKSFFNVKGFPFETKQCERIFSQEMEDSEFDMNNFEYRPERGKFVLKVYGEFFAKKSTKNSITDLLNKKTYMPNCDLGYFINTTCFEFCLVIGNDTNHNRTISFKTEVTPDVLKHGIIDYNNKI